jgi:hypothetical protein
MKKRTKLHPLYPADCQRPDDAGVARCQCGRLLITDNADDVGGLLVCQDCRRLATVRTGKEGA